MVWFFCFANFQNKIATFCFTNLFRGHFLLGLLKRWVSALRVGDSLGAELFSGCGGRRCLQLVQAINGERLERIVIRLSWTISNSCQNFHYVKRDCNMVASLVAKRSLFVVRREAWRGVFFPWLSDIISSFRGKKHTGGIKSTLSFWIFTLVRSHRSFKCDIWPAITINQNNAGYIWSCE